MQINILFLKKCDYLTQTSSRITPTSSCLHPCQAICCSPNSSRKGLLKTASKKTCHSFTQNHLVVSHFSQNKSKSLSVAQIISYRRSGLSLSFCSLLLFTHSATWTSSVSRQPLSLVRALCSNIPHTWFNSPLSVLSLGSQ